MKDERIYIRVSAEQKAKMERLAAHFGKTISATVLMLIEREVNALDTRAEERRNQFNEARRSQKEKAAQDRQTEKEETLHKEN